MIGHSLTSGLRKLNRHYQSDTYKTGISYETVGEDFFFPGGQSVSFYKMLWNGRSCYVCPYGSVFFDYYREKKTIFGVGRKTSGIRFQYTESDGLGNSSIIRRIRGASPSNYEMDFLNVSPDIPKNPIKIVLTRNTTYNDYEMFMIFDEDYIPGSKNVSGDIPISGNPVNYIEKSPTLYPDGLIYRYISPIWEDSKSSTQIGHATTNEPAQPLAGATISHCLVPHVKRFGYIPLKSSQFNDDTGKMEDFAKSFGCPFEWVTGSSVSGVRLNAYKHLSARAGQCSIPRGGELVRLPSSYKYTLNGGTCGACGWSGQWPTGAYDGEMATPVITSRMSYQTGAYADAGGQVTIGGIVSRYSVPVPQRGTLGSSTKGLFHTWNGMNIDWFPVYELNKLEYVNEWHL